ncbi:exosortase K [Niabella beijingensis]|uniref:exosortase K n=1 Tax=Niabella beijingensis TaxID=2872700 RepID=UPI001CC123B8|nr:exosortase K [Niabella beijingensis]MBZ4190186.1 exosortase K [Niabella beijingensis]
MQTREKIIFTVLGGLLLAGLKLLLRSTDIQQQLFLLAPVSTIVEIASAHKAQFIPGEGFFFPDLNVLINKSCSGASFMLTALLPAGYLLLKYAGSIKQLLKMLPLALLTVYLTTILANTSRILTAIGLKQTGLILNNTTSLHELQGAAIYLFYLTTACLLAEKWFHSKFKTYENAA